MTYIAPSKRLVHKGLIRTDDVNAVAALCVVSKDPGTQTALNIDEAFWVMSSSLHADITCPDCRRLLNVPDEPSLTQILMDNVAIRLNAARHFADVHYWNNHVRLPDEAPINPDQTGEMAALFNLLTVKFEQFMEPLMDLMTKHEGHFGWPEVISKEDE